MPSDILLDGLAGVTAIVALPSGANAAATCNYDQTHARRRRCARRPRHPGASVANGGTPRSVRGRRAAAVAASDECAVRRDRGHYRPRHDQGIRLHDRAHAATTTIDERTATRGQ